MKVTGLLFHVVLLITMYRAVLTFTSLKLTFAHRWEPRIIEFGFESEFKLDFELDFVFSFC